MSSPALATMVGSHSGQMDHAVRDLDAQDTGKFIAGLWPGYLIVDDKAKNS